MGSIDCLPPWLLLRFDEVAELRGAAWCLNFGFYTPTEHTIAYIYPLSRPSWCVTAASWWSGAAAVFSQVSPFPALEAGSLAHRNLGKSTVFRGVIVPAAVETSHRSPFGR